MSVAERARRARRGRVASRRPGRRRTAAPRAAGRSGRGPAIDRRHVSRPTRESEDEADDPDDEPADDDDDRPWRGGGAGSSAPRAGPRRAPGRAARRCTGRRGRAGPAGAAGRPPGRGAAGWRRGRGRPVPSRSVGSAGSRAASSAALGSVRSVTRPSCRVRRPAVAAVSRGRPGAARPPRGRSRSAPAGPRRAGIPRITWSAPSADELAGRHRARPRRSAAVVPVATWPANVNAVGSRPIASSSPEDRRATLAEVGAGRSSAPAGRTQPSASRAASAMPRGRWPPSQIGGPAGGDRRGQVRRRRGAGRTGRSRVTPGGRAAASENERPDHADGRLEPVERARRSAAAGSRTRRARRSCQPGAEAEDEPAAGDVVEDRRRLGQDRRMAERVRQDRRARATGRAPGGRARRGA